MKDRWLPVGVLAGVLFVINAICRFVVWQVVPKNDSKQIVIGVLAVGAVSLVMVVAAYRWAVRYPMSRVIPELAIAAISGCLLSVLVGPFAGGSRPLREGSAFFVGEIWQYLAFAGGGAVLGLLIVIMLGRDYRSQALKRFAETKLAKPRRVVRR
jgi:hypothetical protein